MTPNTSYYQRIIKLAIPVAASNLLNLLTSFVGLSMVSHLGDQELAASALMYATQTTVIVIAMGILFSIGVMVGRNFGAKQYEDIGAVMQQGWILSFLISIPVMLFMLSIKPILLALHQPPILVDLIQNYFHAYLWAVPPLMATACNAQFLLGILRRQLVMLTTAASFTLNTVFAYGLIFGKWGLPALGIAGLGYAMAIQSWLVFLSLLVYFYFSEKFAVFGLFRWRVKSNLHLLKKLFFVGWPISIQMAAELLAFFVVTLMAGWLGPIALSARQISLQYLMILVMITFSLTQAASILIGHAMGAKNYGEVKPLGDHAIVLAIMLSIIGLIIFVTLPKLLIAGFVNVHSPANQMLVHLTSLLLLIMGIGQLFDSVRNVATGALRGLFDTRFPMVISLFCLWGVAVPLGYFLAFNLHQGVIGLAIAFNIALITGAFIVWWRWRNRLPDMLANAKV